MTAHLFMKVNNVIIIKALTLLNINLGHYFDAYIYIYMRVCA